jgi:hypothetical protein
MPYGLRGYIGLGKETTWGTAVAPTDFVQGLSEALVGTFDRYDIANITGSLLEPDRIAGVVRVEGELVAPAYPDAVGILANAAFGQGSRTVTIVLSGALWQTAWYPSPSDFGSASPLPSYTIEVYRDLSPAQRHPGANATALTISAQPNAPLQASARWLARNVSSGTPATATFPTSPSAPFDFSAAQVLIAGAQDIDYEGISITLDNQLEGVPSLGSSLITRIRRRDAVQVRVAGTLAFEKATDLDRFLKQTEVALSLRATLPASFALQVDVPRLVFTAFPVTMRGRERITVAFEGEGRVHPGSRTNIGLLLTTTRSAW